MHILFREQRSLDEAAAAVELGHSPADLVLLSFSDADLGAAAMAWRHSGLRGPGCGWPIWPSSAIRSRSISIWNRFWPRESGDRAAARRPRLLALRL